MKKLLYVIVCAFMVSCSSTPKEKETIVAVNDSPDTTVNLHPELDSSTPTITEEQTVSNNDWDSALNEYEQYMDEYIKFIKKSQAGDATAMLDAAELMSKAESTGKRLDEARDELTPKQIKKLTKIQNKMLTAMQK